MSNEITIASPEWESNDVIYNPVSINDKEGRLATRSLIDSYEKKLIDVIGSEHGVMDEVNQEGLNEYFVGGAYTRSLLIPKGITIVSKLWKKERLWVIVSGDVTFTTETGTRRVKGPFIDMAPYGSKVALYAHEDTLWLAITGAESTDSKSIEEEVVVENYSELVYPWDKLEKEGEQ